MTDEIIISPDIRGKPQSQSADEVIQALVAAQEGRLARRQLLAAGVHPASIDRRITRGQLLPTYPGVYAAGHRSRDRLAGLWAAWLYVGDDGVFSHRSGAELWEVPISSSALIEITAPRVLRSRPGLRLHCSAIPADEIVTREGLPVTTISRTVLDLAAELPPRPLERLLEECHRRELGDALGFDGILSRYPGRSGTGRLRTVLGRWDPGSSWTRSRLEERFIAFLDAHNLPRGVANAYVRAGTTWFECDHVWHRQRVIVELDSREHHDDPLAIDRDSAKRRALTAAGWTVIVVTWWQLHHDQASLATDLRCLLD